MDRQNERFVNHQATSVAIEWGKTFLTQSVIGLVLAVVWAMLGLQ